MLEKDQPPYVPTCVEITAAQQGLIQLLAKAVAERLADKHEIRESHSNPTDEQA